MDNKLEFDVVEFTQWGKDHGFSDETAFVYSQILPRFVRFIKRKGNIDTLDDQVIAFMTFLTQDPINQDQEGDHYLSLVRLVLDNFKAWDMYTKDEISEFQAAHPLKATKGNTAAKA